MMKKTIELVKYQLSLYFKGSNFVMPFVALFVFMYMMYSIIPVGIVDSFSISCYLTFLIMVWVGLSMSSREQPVMEQILLLRVHSEFSYYFSKVISLTIIGLLMDAICVLFPIVQNLLNNQKVFITPLTGFDILNAILLLAGCSFAGGAVGSLFHTRVLRQRKMAILLTLLMAIFTVTRTAISQEIWLFNFVAFIFPPVDSIFLVYKGTAVFRLEQSFFLFLALFIYGITVSVLKSVICYKRKF